MLTKHSFPHKKTKLPFSDWQLDNPFANFASSFMAGFKDFISMTRRERRGTVAVLLLIVLLLVGSVLTRSCRPDEEYRLNDVEIQQFEESIDSAVVIESKHAKKRKNDTTKHKRRHRRTSHKKSKPAAEPRRMDPVPQF